MQRGGYGPIWLRSAQRMAQRRSPRARGEERTGRRRSLRSRRFMPWCMAGNAVRSLTPPRLARATRQCGRAGRACVGARSAPPGHVTVPVSASTSTLGEPGGGAGFVEDPAVHPVEHVDLPLQAVGEGGREDAVANNAGLGYVGRQTDHCSAAIECSVSPARARRQFSNSSSWCSSAHASTKRSCRRPRLLSITSSVSMRTFAPPAAWRAGSGADGDRRITSQSRCRRSGLIVGTLRIFGARPAERCGAHRRRRGRAARNTTGARNGLVVRPHATVWCRASTPTGLAWRRRAG
jgi:hypothetical protein